MMCLRFRTKMLNLMINYCLRKSGSFKTWGDIRRGWSKWLLSMVSFLCCISTAFKLQAALKHSPTSLISSNWTHSAHERKPSYPHSEGSNYKIKSIQSRDVYWAQPSATVYPTTSATSKQPHGAERYPAVTPIPPAMHVRPPEAVPASPSPMAAADLSPTR
jgi:hypothetical protein